MQLCSWLLVTSHTPSHRQESIWSPLTLWSLSISSFCRTRLTLWSRTSKLLRSNTKVSSKVSLVVRVLVLRSSLFLHSWSLTSTLWWITCAAFRFQSAYLPVRHIWSSLGHSMWISPVRMQRHLREVSLVVRFLKAASKLAMKLRSDQATFLVAQALVRRIGSRLSPASHLWRLMKTTLCTQYQVALLQSAWKSTLSSLDQIIWSDTSSVIPVRCPRCSLK